LKTASSPSPRKRAKPARVQGAAKSAIRASKNLRAGTTKWRSKKGTQLPRAKKSRSSGPVPQEALLHFAKTLPTPDVFNDVPEKMPFDTDDQ
jgi:hypothetical protein